MWTQTVGCFRGRFMYSINSKCLNHMDQGCWKWMCIFLMQEYKNISKAQHTVDHNYKLYLKICSIKESVTTEAELVSWCGSESSAAPQQTSAEASDYLSYSCLSSKQTSPWHWSLPSWRYITWPCAQPILAAAPLVDKIDTFGVFFTFFSA